MDQSLEEELKARVIPLLEHGRPNWDLPHTLAAVKWMKKLLEHEEGDEKVLVTTMYLHDVGYSEYPGQLEGFEACTFAAKSDHMERGVVIAKRMLEGMDYSAAERERVLHLVGIHDSLDKLAAPDEILVFEADCLGQIDYEAAPSNFSSAENKKWMRFFLEKRAPRFKTATGKGYLAELLPRAVLAYGL